MLNFFKKEKEADTPSQQKNWYADRYQSAVIQRNFLMLFVFIAVIGIIISVFTVVHVSSSKTIEPFVIEVEEKTGITNVIRPLLKEQFAYDEALRRYFIMKYLNARETYDYYSFNYNYFTVVRLLSTSSVYNSFRSQVYVDNPNSPVRLGKGGSRDIKIKSMTYLKTAAGERGFTIQIRVRIDENSNKEGKRTLHKIITMTFDYFDLKLTTEERNVNPLGFQVMDYRVSDEVL
ncbi:type IV secretion system protein [Rickettsiales bacterium]|nr:type IV secretion system protein [Rickettsiales bacterium]